SGEIDEIDKEIEKFEKILGESEIPTLTEEVERIKAEIRRWEDRVRDIDARINTINIEKDFTDKRRDEIEERLNELEERKKQLKDKIKEYQEGITIFEEGLKEKMVRAQELEVELVDMRKVRDGLLEEMAKVEVEKNNIQNDLERVEVRIEVLSAMKDDLQAQINEINREVEACDIGEGEDVPPHEVLLENIMTLKTKMEEMEPVNMRAIEEYDAVQERGHNLQTKRDILFRERNEIIDRIQHYEQMKKDAFMENFLAINAHFKEIFARLSGGEGELVLETWEDPFAGGLSIKAKPAGKTIRRMESMSGGEKSLTALAFIFAIQKHRPAPFYAFDEIDMFLDGANAERVASMIKNASKNAQFIVVSLRESMVKSADRTIGVTMQEDNISSITGVRLN
ncbi:MAG: AAA family ATPase, partial [Methanocellales archaeon]|nr:AAA family ATPase [Methanocellales archaeon]